LIKVYHNDTPCPHLLEPMSDLGFDVFNFSHTIDIAEARAKLPAITLMGNVPPLDVMARGTPAQVTDWARACIEKTGGRGLILSAGGGVSPDTPLEAIDALVAASRATVEHS
jgi:uroporphyrinogen decarboxylase